MVFGQEEAGEDPNIPDVNVSIGEDTTNIRDTTLRAETVVEGLEFPTSHLNKVKHLTKTACTVKYMNSENGKLLITMWKALPEEDKDKDNYF